MVVEFLNPLLRFGLLYPVLCERPDLLLNETPFWMNWKIMSIPIHWTYEYIYTHTPTNDVVPCNLSISTHSKSLGGTLVCLESTLGHSSCCHWSKGHVISMARNERSHDVQVPISRRRRRPQGWRASRPKSQHENGKREDCRVLYLLERLLHVPWQRS